MKFLRTYTNHLKFLFVLVSAVLRIVRHARELLYILLILATECLDAKWAGSLKQVKMPHRTLTRCFTVLCATARTGRGKTNSIENKINFPGIAWINVLSGLTAWKLLNGKIQWFDAAVHLRWSTASREKRYGHKEMKIHSKALLLPLFSLAYNGTYILNQL